MFYWQVLCLIHADLYSSNLKYPSTLPSTLVVGYYDERLESETGQYQPQMVRLEILDRLRGPTS